MKELMKRLLMMAACGIVMGGGCTAGAIGAGVIVPRKSLTDDVAFLRAQLYEMAELIEAIDAGPMPQGWDEMEGLE